MVAKQQQTSSPKGNDRSPESQHVLKMFCILHKKVKDGQGQITLLDMVGFGLILKRFKTTVVLVTCKNEEDRIKNGGTRVFTALYIDFSDSQGQETQ